MPADPLTESLFESLFARDASGGSWLTPLLAATPHADRLGELVEAPGWLQSQLAVHSPASGRLGCLEYPAAMPKGMLSWFIDHPDRLVWPSANGVEMSAETVRLRRALLHDDPPGARARAQERARERLARSSGLTADWWRFEDPATLDCVLITERLVVTVLSAGTDGVGAATAWYPQRSRLIANLEAARHLADGKRYASLVLCEHPLAEARDEPSEPFERTLAAGAPHLSEHERLQLRDGYLGTLTWEAACDAVGLPHAAPARPPRAR